MIRVHALTDICRDMINVFVTQVREDPLGLHPATRWGLLIRDGISEWVPVAEGAEPPITYTFNAETGALIYGALRDLYDREPQGVVDSALTRVEQILDRTERLVQSVA